MQIKRDSLAVQLSATTTTTTTKGELAALEWGQQMGHKVMQQLSTREYLVKCLLIAI